MSNNSTDEPDDRPEPVSDPTAESAPDQDDVGDDPTLKDLVSGKVVSPQLSDAAKRAVREAMRNFNLPQNQAVFKAMRSINFPVNQAVQKAMRDLTESSALRNSDLAKLLPTIDTKRLIAPIVDQFKPTNDLLNARIRAQLAASLPSSQLTKQVEQIRKTVGASFLPRFTLPPSTFKNLDGRQPRRPSALSWLRVSPVLTVALGSMRTTSAPSVDTGWCWRDVSEAERVLLRRAKGGGCEQRLHETLVLTGQ